VSVFAKPGSSVTMARVPVSSVAPTLFVALSLKLPASSRVTSLI